MSFVLEVKIILINILLWSMKSCHVKAAGFFQLLKSFGPVLALWFHRKKSLRASLKGRASRTQPNLSAAEWFLTFGLSFFLVISLGTVGLEAAETLAPDNPGTAEPFKTEQFLEYPLSIPLAPLRPEALSGRSCSVRLMAVGDILIHNSVRNAAALKDGGFDFVPSFEHVAKVLSQGNLVIANLENPLAGIERGLSGYPNFNAPDELALGLKQSGFTAVTVSNNHSLDRGWAGLLKTLKTVDAAGLAYFGAYESPEDKAARLVGVYNGVKISVLNYTYGLNGPTVLKPEEDWRLGHINTELIFKDMAAARAMGAEFVIIALHFGNEYQRNPSRGQQDLVTELLTGREITGQAGADLILGHHPHVVQPFVYWMGENGEATQAVIYSLGNFISSQQRPYTFMGLIFDVTLTIEADGRRSIGPFRLIPTYCYKGNEDNREVYKVLPLDLAAANPEIYGVDKATAEQMSNYFKEMSDHLVSMLPPPPPQSQ
ncbi:MAG: CapA family protein [Deltaproteobacteria bacterium]|jgi:poly-gamma-glutamate synthesis protein (capsule biosynthesis protein)|nr:CapA family protein [Deltaproteobacteria bacterium]